MESLHFVQLSDENDESFHEMISKIFYSDEPGSIHPLSNIQLHYDAKLLISSSRECSIRRKKISRMQKERQNYVFDILSESIDMGRLCYIFRGTFGFIKVNRITNEASVLYLMDPCILESFASCITSIVNAAKLPDFRLNKLICNFVDDRYEQVLKATLYACSFYEIGRFTAEDHTIISFAGDIANSPSAFSKSNRFDKAKNTTFFNSPVNTPSQSPHESSGSGYFYPIVSPSAPASFYCQNEANYSNTVTSSQDKSLYYRIPFSNSMDDDSTSGSHDKSRLPEGTVDLASRVSLEDVQPEPYRPSIEPSIYYGAPHTPLQPESPVSSLGWDQEGRLQQDQINKKKNNSCKYDKCCIFWLKGVCMYGPNCFYRHSTTELEASQPAGLRSPTVTKEEAKYDSVNRAADPIVTLLDMINNANTNWLRGLRFQECLLKDRSDQSLPDSPSGNSSRENSDGLRPEHFSSVMIEAITRHRGAFRERGAAGCPFASIEECLEVVGLDCSMASVQAMLLLNKDICSEYQQVVISLLGQTDTDSAIRSSSSSFSPESDGSSLPLSVPLPYPATIMSMPMQPFQYAAVPTSAPLAFQDMDQRQCQYQYQQRLASQWNYMMYYVPLSPQGQTKTASGATGSECSASSGSPSASSTERPPRLSADSLSALPSSGGLTGRSEVRSGPGPGTGTGLSRTFASPKRSKVFPKTTRRPPCLSPVAFASPSVDCSTSHPLPQSPPHSPPQG